uniref:Uncharacterized protein n=1 Tax=Panagrolaimus davidi TaxID=227884 RepID=A0A914R4P2_9BILA
MSHGKMMFEEDNKNAYLVMASSEEGSQIVSIDNGKCLFIQDRLPIGHLCHSTNPNVRCNVEKQYLYDIYCSSFLVQEIIQPPSFKVYALRIKECKVIQGIRFGNEIFYLQPPGLNIRIKNVLQIFDRNISLKEYVRDKVVDGLVDCWITPVRTSTTGFAEWVLVPVSIPPKPLYVFTKLYAKMKDMFSNNDNGPRLGVVVGIGKIAVFHYLINCPKDFVLGSTHICKYEIKRINGFPTVVLIKSKPVKLKRRYIETFVTKNGSVLIKTVVGKPIIGQWNIKMPSLKAQSFTPGISPKIIPPDFNYTLHPFFGKIYFSSKMIWSAPTLKVIISATMNSTCKFLTASSKGNEIFIYYRILGFHDSEKYWRVPDVPDDMHDLKNFLIQNNVPMCGDSFRNTRTFKSKQFHPPQMLKNKCKIEGRYLSNQFIKHPECERFVEETENNQEEENDKFVLHNLQQISRSRR